MKKYLIFIFCILFACFAYADDSKAIGKDTSNVIELNTQGFKMRLTSPEQTIADATKALDIATKIGYKRGMAESHRVIGVGYYYIDESVKAIHNYLTALNYFMEIKDLAGEGRVYNNIGNLYRNTDYDLSLDFFNKSAVKDRIKLQVGNALEIIPTLNESWDMVFIDADNVNYINYYEMALPQLKPGGFMIADNVLFHGQVLEKQIEGKNAKAIHAFNEHVKKDNRVEQVLLTVRDGLMLILKK